MSLKIKVKAGNISHLTDARYFSAMLVDYLGFPVSSMGSLEIKEIIPWVSGPEMVLEFEDNANLDSIFSYMAETEVQIIQLSIKHSLDLPEEIKRIYKHSIKTEEDWIEIKNSIDSSGPALYHLLEFSELSFSDLDKSFLNEIKSISEEIPLMIDIDLSASEILSFNENWPQVDLHLKGSKEEKVGQKAYDLMDEILECLEED